MQSPTDVSTRKLTSNKKTNVTYLRIDSIFACSDRSYRDINPFLVSKTLFFLRVYLFGAVLTFLFFVLSGCCAVLRSVLLSTFCTAVLTMGVLGRSVWRCARTKRVGWPVFGGAQYISRRRSSQLWKQHSSTMPRDRRALGP